MRVIERALQLVREKIWAKLIIESNSVKVIQMYQVTKTLQTAHKYKTLFLTCHLRQLYMKGRTGSRMLSKDQTWLQDHVRDARKPIQHQGTTSHTWKWEKTADPRPERFVDDQQTLLSLLSAGPTHLDPEKSGDVIFVHGTSHQGSRTSLIVHKES